MPSSKYEIAYNISYNEGPHWRLDTTTLHGAELPGVRVINHLRIPDILKLIADDANNNGYYSTILNKIAGLDNGEFQVTQKGSIITVESQQGALVTYTAIGVARRSDVYFARETAIGYGFQSRTCLNTADAISWIEDSLSLDDNQLFTRPTGSWHGDRFTMKRLEDVLKGCDCI